ncbi:glycosyltransferase family 4 protein [Nakamurella flavida]|uniref:Glycosyltransferase family 4 protein n=1 Tax=Nakamurella flavida TaxID=363630 RepID=A0A938YGM1_9ACTN|nr:glycosyltransferase family 4 protein [Nakamurella flavida]MBM9477320.1 glycosyltransferase family 4 protein [Nakamurella flavida]MDP9779776.1 glycosyltransferase involved in cell wall biosynthesis [Nakamurella flavida]
MTGRTPASATRTLLIANPSSDVYGSDLQMLETISAVVEAGWRVVVTTPDDGPLIAMMQARGAVVDRVDYPVLRRENASATGMVKLLLSLVPGALTIVRTLRRVRPDVVYVNTVTLPWWLLVTRLLRVPVVCHVHEAEMDDSRLVRTALIGPLVLARRLIVISEPALQAVGDAVPRLRARSQLIYNGVPEPTGEITASTPGAGPRRLAIVGRLSPRKGTDVALEAVAALRADGRDVVLDVCGTAFEGYEWFVDQLHTRAGQPDLAGAVTFSGYVNPVWPALERAEVVLAPSLREPFGNAVVEAQLAARPVVAAAALGHLETVQDDSTGLLVPPGDATAMAAAAARLLDDADLARRLGEHGRTEALRRFSIARYRREVVELLTRAATRR